MKHVYAALLLHETGAEIDEQNLAGVLAAAGDRPSESRTKALVAALEDVDLDHTGADDEPGVDAGPDGSGGGATRRAGSEGDPRGS